MKNERKKKRSSINFAWVMVVCLVIALILSERSGGNIISSPKLKMPSIGGITKTQTASAIPITSREEEQKKVTRSSAANHVSAKSATKQKITFHFSNVYKNAFALSETKRMIKLQGDGGNIGDITKIVKLLFAGPTGEEKQDGYVNIVPSGTIVKKVELTGDRVAVIYLTTPNGKNFNDIIWEAIEETTTSIPGVWKTKLRVNKKK